MVLEVELVTWRMKPAIELFNHVRLFQDEQEGTFEKWRVENSWGEERGCKGNIIHRHGTPLLTFMCENNGTRRGALFARIL